MRKLNIVASSKISRYTPSEAMKKYKWMTKHQAEIFSKTWDAALKEYGTEEKAFAVALAAAKKAGK